MPSFESSLQNFDKFTRRCTHQSLTASETNLRGNVFSALAVVVLHPSFCFSHMKKKARSVHSLADRTERVPMR